VCSSIVTTWVLLLLDIACYTRMLPTGPPYVNHMNYTITSIVGGGTRTDDGAPASEWELRYPQGIDLDTSNGDLFFVGRESDSNLHHYVRSDATVRTIPRDDAGRFMWMPSGVTLHGDRLYFVDADDMTSCVGSIPKNSAAGSFDRVVTNSYLRRGAVAFDNEGNMYYVVHNGETGRGDVQRLNLSSSVAETVWSVEAGGPYYMRYSNGFLYVSAFNAGWIGRLDLATKQPQDVLSRDKGIMPMGIDVDPQGYVVFAAVYPTPPRIMRVGVGGEPVLLAGGGSLRVPYPDGTPGPSADFHDPQGVVLDPASGDIYFTTWGDDSSQHRVLKLTPVA